MIPGGLNEPLNEFQRNPQGTLDRLANSDLAVVLTVDGEPRAVVQEAGAYQRLLDTVERAEIVLAVRAGMDEAARGEGFELEEADKMIRARLGFPPRT